MPQFGMMPFGGIGGMNMFHHHFFHPGFPIGFNFLAFDGRHMFHHHFFHRPFFPFGFGFDFDGFGRMF